MRQSPGAAKLRDAFYANGGNDVNNVGYGHFEAARDTVLRPVLTGGDWTDTSTQVGGFGGEVGVNNGDGTVTFTIPNDAGRHSFAAGQWTGEDNPNGPTGPRRTIKQTFIWTEYIDKSKVPQGK